MGSESRPVGRSLPTIARCTPRSPSSQSRPRSRSRRARPSPLLLQTAAAHGRRVALANIAGNSVGVLIWGCLSAVGVSALIAANHLAYDTLRFTGAGFPALPGVRALLSRGSPSAVSIYHDRKLPLNQSPTRRPQGPRQLPGEPEARGLLRRALPAVPDAGARPCCPRRSGMAGVIVLFDVLVYGTVAIVVDRFRQVLRPHAMRRLSQASGAVLVLFGLAPRARGALA